MAMLWYNGTAAKHTRISRLKRGNLAISSQSNIVRVLRPVRNPLAWQQLDSLTGRNAFKGLA
jgi:hypothetical protein